MNLIIDIGNTFIKAALFEDSKLIHKESFKKEDFLKVLTDLENKFDSIQRVIISSVGDFSKVALQEIKNRYPTFVLTHKDPVPFTNNYESPETLGIDRIALVSAASLHYPNKNVLVIDAGTCITYDFKNSNNQYLGGAISPGIKMRYNALHLLTDKLPNLEPQVLETYIGATTKSSMHIGVIKGVIHEIDGFIARYQEENKELTIILTGGDANYLLDSLKNDIFATSNFLLEGLNYILVYNKDTC